MQDRQRALVALLATWTVVQMKLRKGHEISAENMEMYAEYTCDGLFGALSEEMETEEIVKEVSAAMGKLVYTTIN
jgi:hypothetical protein